MLIGEQSSCTLDFGQAASTQGFLAFCSNNGMSDPLVKALTRLCGGTDRSAKARRQEVADRLGVNEQTLYQIIKGIKLESGRARTVGRHLREKLDAEFPGWFTEDITDTAPPAPDPREELKRSLWIVRQHLTVTKSGIVAGEALRLLALAPDSELVFKNALEVLSPTAGEESPRESGGASPLAHVESQRGTHTSPANPQELGGGDQPEGGEEWNHRGRRIGQSIKPISRTTAAGQKPGKEKAK